MSKSIVCSTIAAMTLFVASAAQAQSPAAPVTRNPIELGIDAGATFGLDSPHVTTISIPAQNFRVGFMVSPHISFEPSAQLHYVHVSGLNVTTYEAVVGMLYHLSTDRRTSQVYVRPFVGFIGASGGGSSDTQAEIGAGLGVKVPVSPRVGTRFEANYQHGFSSGSISSSNGIGLLAGLSFFVR